MNTMSKYSFYIKENFTPENKIENEPNINEVIKREDEIDKENI